MVFNVGKRWLSQIRRKCDHISSRGAFHLFTNWTCVELTFFSVPHIFAVVIHHSYEGARTLYSGLSAHLMRVVPNAAVMYSIYEGIIKWGGS